MFKVMIVDDEVLVRAGIKSLISWEQHGFQYISDASDGIDALESIRLQVPDILLTDIIMPNMDGLELIKRVKNEYPSIRIIVLSSHHDYPYLRDALKSGADDYLLKGSLKPDDLLICLQDVSRRILERREHKEPAAQAIKREEQLLAWLRAEEPEEDVHCNALDMEWMNSRHQLFLVKLDQLDEGNREIQTLGNLIEQFMRNWVKTAYVLLYKPYELVVIVERSPALSEQDIVQMGKDMIVTSRRFLSISCSVGVSLDFTGYIHLKQAFEEASIALEQSYYEGTEEVFSYDPERTGDRLASHDFFSRQRLDIFMQAFILGDAAQVRLELEKFYTELLQLRPLKARANQLQLELMTCIQMRWKDLKLPNVGLMNHEKPLYSKVLAFTSLVEAKDWFCDLFDSYCGEMKANKENRSSKEIVQLTEYIMNHYTESLSLKKAAEYVNLSEGYLGYLFKREIGKSYVDYVTDLRMQKALDYLNNTDLPIYSIAELVGYQNVNYFGRLFKKKMGVSPNQYREK